jgi:hypothetical protein
MTYTKEKLAELAARALEMRGQAHKLETEQAQLDKNALGTVADRYRALGLRARMLRTEADRIYAPVLEALQGNCKINPCL